MWQRPDSTRVGFLNKSEGKKNLLQVGSRQGGRGRRRAHRERWCWWCRRGAFSGWWGRRLPLGTLAHPWCTECWSPSWPACVWWPTHHFLTITFDLFYLLKYIQTNMVTFLFSTILLKKKKKYRTGKSLWVNIHPLQRVVIFHFENHFDLIGAVSLGAERREKTYGQSPNTTLHSRLQDSSLKRTADHCF